MRGLLLDIGGVLIRTPFELLDAAEAAHGLSPGALGARGPFGPPGSDPDFAAVGNGSLTERAYWARRAAAAAAVLGTAGDTKGLMDVLFDLPAEVVLRPETIALVRDAERAGVRIGLLTNDLHDFHGPGWLNRLGAFGAPPHAIVDGSLTGHLKPHPRAYELAIGAMGLPAGQVVYLDDQPVNVAGGEVAGLRAIAFDVHTPARSVEAARQALGVAVTPAG